MEMKANLRRLLVSALVLALLVAAFAWFINLSWFDEALHPDLIALSTPHSVSMDGNSLPLLYGLSAASDRNARDVGLAIVRELRGRYERGEKIKLSDAQTEALRTESELDRKWRIGLPSLRCNSRLALDCASPLIAEVEQIDMDQPRLRLLLQRYDEILRTAQFNENEEQDISTPMPRFGMAMKIARIRLAISFRQDTFDDFLTHVKEDTNFWRLVMRNGQMIITKMVATAGFRNNLEFISSLIRSRDLSTDQIESIRDLLRPLSREELDSGEMFVAEMRAMMMSENSLLSVVVGESWMTRMLYQENATLNEYYLKTTMPLRLRASLDAETFYNQHGYEKLPYSIRKFPPPLYNLGGRLILKKIFISSPQDYISRMHDLNGEISLVLLQLEIEQKPDESVAAVIKSSRHRNPYTKGAIKYDRMAGTIGFDCLRSYSNDVCSVSIAQAVDELN